MAEIVEVFEDGAENVKKFVKKNPLVVAGLGVGALALYVLWVKSRESSVDTTAYEAIGYGGYPVVGGGSADSGENIYSSSESDSYYEEIVRENQTQTDSLLQQITQENNATLAEMESAIGYLSDRVISAEEREAEYQAQIKRQNAVSQMRANSELYNTLTSPADDDTKAALHAENMSIAEEMGWTFDPSTGNYFEGNSVVYTTAKQEAGFDTSYGGSKKTSGTFVNNKTYNNSVIDSVLKANQNGGFVEGVDYSALYEEAAKGGADSATLKAIQTGRQNKVNSQYGGVDPNPSSRAAQALYQKDGKTYTTASDGKPIEVERTAYGSGMKTSVTTTSMARDKSRAGTTITANGWKTTYDENGYAVKKVKAN